MAQKQNQSNKVKRAAGTPRKAETPKAGPHSQGYHKPSKGTQVSWISDEVRERREAAEARRQAAENRRKAQEARAARAAEQEAANEHRRAMQAEQARQHSAFKRLREGSPAYLLVCAALDLFPTATPPADSKLSRTKYALQLAADKLSKEIDPARLTDGVCKCAGSVTSQILWWAGSELNSSKPTVTPKDEKVAASDETSPLGEEIAAQATAWLRNQKQTTQV